MNGSTDRPTLLVFTLGPRCEGSRRRLLPRSLRQSEILLHEQGLRGALEAGRRAGLRVVVASPQPLDLPTDIEQIRQRGRSFADRFRGALGSVQKAYPDSPLLVVGTDTLDLDSAHLESAVRHLAQSPEDVVIGPSLDGGFYLLATRVALDSELAQVSWCRSSTLRCLLDEIRRRGRRVHLLEPLHDLDHHSGVERWLSDTARDDDLAWLRRWLLGVLAAWRRPSRPPSPWRLRPAMAGAVLGRAPPF